MMARWWDNQDVEVSEAFVVISRELEHKSQMLPHEDKPNVIATKSKGAGFKLFDRATEFPNFFYNVVTALQSAGTQEKAAYEKVIKLLGKNIDVILGRVLVPHVAAPTSKTIVNAGFFAALQKKLQDRIQIWNDNVGGDPVKLKVFVGGGVVRSLLAYIYIELYRKMQQKQAQAPKSAEILDRVKAQAGIAETSGDHSLAALLRDSIATPEFQLLRTSMLRDAESIYNFYVFGVGSDMDVYIELDRPMPEFEQELMLLATEFINSAAAELQTQNSDALQQSFFPTADVRSRVLQLHDAVAQGGSTIDYLSFLLHTEQPDDQGRRLIQPDEKLLQGLDLMTDFVNGFYHYLQGETPATAKQIIRGLRALLELPFITIKDIAVLEQQLSELDLTKLNEAAKLQLDKLVRNAYASAANNRAYRPEVNGLLKFLAEKQLLPVFTHRSPITSEREVTGAFNLEDYLLPYAEFCSRCCSSNAQGEHILFHGTDRADAMLGIIRGGFYLSNTTIGQGASDFGSGLYLTADKIEAMRYNPFIFELALQPNPFIRILNLDDLKTKNPSLYAALKDETNRLGYTDVNELLYERYHVDVVIHHYPVAQNVNIFKAPDLQLVLTAMRNQALARLDGGQYSANNFIILANLIVNILSLNKLLTTREHAELEQLLKDKLISYCQNIYNQIYSQDVNELEKINNAMQALQDAGLITPQLAASCLNNINQATAQFLTNSMNPSYYAAWKNGMGLQGRALLVPINIFHGFIAGTNAVRNGTNTARAAKKFNENDYDLRWLVPHEIVPLLKSEARFMSESRPEFMQLIENTLFEHLFAVNAPQSMLVGFKSLSQEALKSMSADQQEDQKIVGMRLAWDLINMNRLLAWNGKDLIAKEDLLENIIQTAQLLLTSSNIDAVCAGLAQIVAILNTAQNLSQSPILKKQALQAIYRIKNGTVAMNDFEQLHHALTTAIALHTNSILDDAQLAEFRNLMIEKAKKLEFNKLLQWFESISKLESSDPTYTLAKDTIQLVIDHIVIPQELQQSDSTKFLMLLPEVFKGNDFKNTEQFIRGLCEPFLPAAGGIQDYLRSIADEKMFEELANYSGRNKIIKAIQSGDVATLQQILVNLNREFTATDQIELMNVAVTFAATVLIFTTADAYSLVSNEQRRKILALLYATGGKIDSQLTLEKIIPQYHGAGLSEVIAFFKEQGATITHEVLRIAVDHNHLADVWKYVEPPIDVNYKVKHFGKKISLLMYAHNQGRLESFKLLLENGAAITTDELRVIIQDEYDTKKNFGGWQVEHGNRLRTLLEVRPDLDLEIKLNFVTVKSKKEQQLAVLDYAIQYSRTRSEDSYYQDGSGLINRRTKQSVRTLAGHIALKTYGSSELSKAVVKYIVETDTRHEVVFAAYLTDTLAFTELKRAQDICTYMRGIFKKAKLDKYYIDIIDRQLMEFQKDKFPAIGTAIPTQLKQSFLWLQKRANKAISKENGATVAPGNNKKPGGKSSGV